MPLTKSISSLEFKFELKKNNYLIGTYIGIFDKTSKSWSLVISLGRYISFYIINPICITYLIIF
jgi:hypothetical protein